MEKAAGETLSSLAVTTVRSVRQLVASLSGGQRQSVAIAKAVLWNSKLVIMDEPTAALGVAQTTMVLNLVRRLADRGLAVLLVSHNMNDVFEVADRIAVLRLGRLVAQRPASEMDKQIVVDLMTTGASTRDGRSIVTDTTRPSPSRSRRRNTDERRRARARSLTESSTLATTCQGRLRAHPRGRQRRAAGRRRLSAHLDPVPVAQLELPERRQPRQPADPGRGLHAVGDGRDLRPAARRDRPVDRVRQRHRRHRHGRAGEAAVRLAVVGGDHRRRCSCARRSACCTARSSRGSGCRRSSSRWPACSAGRASCC